MEKNYLYLGITLDKFSKKPEDIISSIEFYNSYTQKVSFHASTDYDDKEKFTYCENNNKFTFDEWKKSLSIYFPLSKEKFEQIKNINTSNHKSLKKFLKSFGFQEYLI